LTPQQRISITLSVLMFGKPLSFPLYVEITCSQTTFTRVLISLDDVMEELDYGPNGGLVYCFQYLCGRILTGCKTSLRMEMMSISS
jgi:hypothetical protein